MSCPGATLAPPRNRTSLARLRLPAARAALAHCRLCACACGVNRLAGPAGRCQAGARPRVFAAQTEVSDELNLIPTFAIAFSGCHLRCDFCITGRESWNARAGQPFDAAQLAQQAVDALTAGARSIMILGGEPTIHLPAVLELIVVLPESATLIWKTNALASAQCRVWLEGLFDLWVADYKFGNDACAQRLAGTHRYTPIVRKNLLWAAQQSELIVRHLVMPGHVDCCWRPIARWLARALPQVPVNLRTGFWPAWQAHRHAELRTTVSERDAARAQHIATEHGLMLVN